MADEAWEMVMGNENSDKNQLAEYQIWDRLQRRLWMRDGLILAIVAAGVLLVVLLGVPLVRANLEQRVMEEARRLVSAEIQANAVDVAALREEIRADTDYVQRTLTDSRVDLEMQLRPLIEDAKRLEATYSGLEVEAAELTAFKNELTALKHALANEETRVKKTRTTYDRELEHLRVRADRFTKNVPGIVRSELGRLEVIVDRELDELRLVMADHMAGKPAMFSTYVDLDKRTGQIIGTNFGEEEGRVYMKIRVFRGKSEPETESESIVVPLEEWDADQIELRISSRVLENVAEVRELATRRWGDDASVGYGFMIQTADGQLSQWSGKRSDSIIPPTARQAER